MLTQRLRWELTDTKRVARNRVNKAGNWDDVALALAEWFKESLTNEEYESLKNAILHLTSAEK